MIGGGLEGSGPSLPLCAASQHRFTAPTERTPSKGSASNGHPVVAMTVRHRLDVCMTAFQPGFPQIKFSSMSITWIRASTLLRQ
jgi:hypothetical protein